MPFSHLSGHKVTRENKKKKSSFSSLDMYGKIQNAADNQKYSVPLSKLNSQGSKENKVNRMRKELQIEGFHFLAPV